MLIEILKTIILLPLIFYIPGYLITNLYYKKLKSVEKVLTSIFISISIAIIYGIIISLLGLFNLLVILVFYVLLNGGLLLKWKFL